jgi:ribA/ribD-fused uncharacterized protein
MIDKFEGSYQFLSNFYPCYVEFEGKTYASTEHAFQAAKTLDPQEREKIRKAGTPGTAKRLGKKVHLRKDWESVKIEVMHAVLQQKFKRGSPLAKMLLETGDQELVEGNTWNDTFWGKCRGKGKNHLGRLLMLVRQELSI